MIWILATVTFFWKSVGEEENWEDIEETNKIQKKKKKSRTYWNPPYTWKFHRKGMVHYDNFDAGLQNTLFITVSSGI